MPSLFYKPVPPACRIYHRPWPLPLPSCPSNDARVSARCCSGFFSAFPDSIYSGFVSAFSARLTGKCQDTFIPTLFQPGQLVHLLPVRRQVGGDKAGQSQSLAVQRIQDACRPGVAAFTAGLTEKYSFYKYNLRL